MNLVSVKCFKDVLKSSMKRQLFSASEFIAKDFEGLIDILIDTR